jgi:hypothetical protein
MNTLTLTAADFTDGQYKNGVLEYAGHVTLASDLGTVRFTRIAVAGRLVAQASTGIEAGEDIKAGWGIKAGEGIEAGWGIKAGEGIEAGWGIKAGEGIHCKFDLSVRLRIFVGLINWRLPTADEQQIVCGRLVSGTVASGTLIETAG